MQKRQMAQAQYKQQQQQQQQQQAARGNIPDMFMPPFKGPHETPMHHMQQAQPQVKLDVVVALFRSIFLLLKISFCMIENDGAIPFSDISSVDLFNSNCIYGTKWGESVSDYFRSLTRALGRNS